MEIDNEAKKVIWSLQDNVRNKEERKSFIATGKKRQNNNFRYTIGVLIGLLSVSYLMTQFQNETIDVCVSSNFCINSENDKLVYILYVFITNVILVFGIYFAYRVGKWLANKIVN